MNVLQGEGDSYSTQARRTLYHLPSSRSPRYALQHSERNALSLTGEVSNTRSRIIKSKTSEILSSARSSSVRFFKYPALRCLPGQDLMPVYIPSNTGNHFPGKLDYILKKSFAQADAKLSIPSAYLDFQPMKVGHTQKPWRWSAQAQSLSPSEGNLDQVKQLRSNISCQAWMNLAEPPMSWLTTATGLGREVPCLPERGAGEGVSLHLFKSSGLSSLRLE